MSSAPDPAAASRVTPKDGVRPTGSAPDTAVPGVSVGNAAGAGGTDRGNASTSERHGAGDPSSSAGPGNVSTSARRGVRLGADRVSPPFARRLGQASTALVGLVLVAWALTVDYRRSVPGFFGDAATYYSMGHSLAADFDFEFRREDLVRVWREFATGPEGIFLKRGRDVHGVQLTGAPPFFDITSTQDPDPERLYYGKGFIDPLFAAPFVWLFGTNGFLVLHAILMTLCFACAYAFLVARSAPVPSALFAGAFLLLSVAPVYMVWLTPDFFNLAVTLLAYFFWTYKEVAGEAHAVPVGAVTRRWLLTPRSDVIAAVLLGIVSFSKPTNILLVGPPLALLLWRRQWWRGIAVGTVFATVFVGLFAWNVAITGEWNYQGGEDRGTFYSSDPDLGGPRIGGFPFQTERHTFDTTGIIRETNRVAVEVLATSDALLHVFRRNLGYFFFGRHTGFVPYFFAGAVAIVLFLLAPRRRPLWQWLTLAGGLGSAIALILYMPYTYSGGGGPVGNRYFLGVYPLFLFIVPPLTSLAAPLVAVAGGALFTAQLVLSPFTVSFSPSNHVKSGPYRLLPAEMTLLNDLPMNVTPSKVKQPLGGVPPVNAYFLDDNVYAREHDAFWVRGESRAEFMLRAPVVDEVTDAGQRPRSLRIRRLEVQLETGAVPNRVTVDAGTGEQVLDIPAHDRRTVTLPMPDGVPYHLDPQYPMNYVYMMAIESESGFIPMFTSGGGDARFLGVFVRIVPHYD